MDVLNWRPFSLAMALCRRVASLWLCSGIRNPFVTVLAVISATLIFGVLPTSYAADTQSTLDDFDVKVTDKVALKDHQRLRRIPLRISIPDADGPFPVIIWSHDKDGTHKAYDDLIQYWVSKGFSCIQALHADKSKDLEDGSTSYETIWRDRVGDIRFVIDALKPLRETYPSLRDQIDDKRVGIGGHGWGAQTAQLIGGAKWSNKTSVSDSRPIAFLFLSPMGTGEQTLLEENSWNSVKRPFLAVTGASEKGRDPDDWKWRIEPYVFSPKKDKFLAFIEKGQHNFARLVGGSESAEGLSEWQAEYIEAASLVFWQAYLKKDKASISALRADRFMNVESDDIKFFAKDVIRKKAPIPQPIFSEPSPRASVSVSPGMERAVIASYDQNRNGLLEADELPERIASMFLLLDDDGDNYLSPAEVRKSLKIITMEASSVKRKTRSIENIRRNSEFGR